MSTIAKTSLHIRKALMRRYSDDIVRDILRSFNYELIKRNKLKRYKSYARILLMHLKQHKNKTTSQDIREGLFPKPKVCTSKNYCIQHNCLVSYQPQKHWWAVVRKCTIGGEECNVVGKKELQQMENIRRAIKQYK